MKKNIWRIIIGAGFFSLVYLINNPFFDWTLKNRLEEIPATIIIILLNTILFITTIKILNWADKRAKK